MDFLIGESYIYFSSNHFNINIRERNRTLPESTMRDVAQLLCEWLAISSPRVTVIPNLLFLCVCIYYVDVCLFVCVCVHYWIVWKVSLAKLDNKI